MPSLERDRFAFSQCRWILEGVEYFGMRLLAADDGSDDLRSQERSALRSFPSAGVDEIEARLAIIPAIDTAPERCHRAW